NPDITALLINFRVYPVAVMADIERAFLQVKVKPDESDFLRYIWFDTSGDTIVYRMRVLPFGLTCAPFLLAAVIRHHIAQFASTHSDTVDSLLNSFYVDDLLSGAGSVEEAKRFYDDAMHIMSAAGMSL